MQNSLTSTACGAQPHGGQTRPPLAVASHGAAAPNQTTCPHCQQPFAAKRKGQQYCARPCAKAATRHTSRGPRTVAESWSERARCRAHNGRAIELAAWLYMTPPAERLGLMAKLIAAARGHDAQLRSIFTDPRLLGASPHEPWLFFRKAPRSYKTIAQAADAYCRRFWGAGVASVVQGHCPEPVTGELPMTSVSPNRPPTHIMGTSTGI